MLMMLTSRAAMPGPNSWHGSSAAADRFRSKIRQPSGQRYLFDLAPAETSTLGSLPRPR